MRYLLLLFLGALLAACSPSPKDQSALRQTRLDTLSRYGDGTPKKVDVQRGDSVIERRTYRRTGSLQRVVRGDSVQTYFEIHDADSAAVLKDYLQGRWRNLSADTSHERESAFYIFEKNRLTFENPSRVPLETVAVEYKNDRTLVTETGMTVRAEIASFDTVRVTGYTLVRLPLDVR